MNTNDILKKVDHTLLAQTATWEDIKVILDDGIKYGTASACIPAAYVKQAAEYVDGKLPICTVIGFPNGYSTTAVKVFETKDAIENGASEIDMVINIGFLKDKRYEEVEDEIRSDNEDKWYGLTEPPLDVMTTDIHGNVSNNETLHFPECEELDALRDIRDFCPPEEEILETQKEKPLTKLIRRVRGR